MSDERFRKSAGEGRESRAMRDRAVTENREISDEERVEMFRQQFFQSSLPDLPKIPGWHTCWLTTTNPRDSIQMRIRLGYQPVKPEDVPGWEYATLKTGDWVGFIGVNEMLAFKLPPFSVLMVAVPLPSTIILARSPDFTLPATT